MDIVEIAGKLETCVNILRKMENFNTFSVFITLGNSTYLTVEKFSDFYDTIYFEITKGKESIVFDIYNNKLSIRTRPEND